MSSVTNFSLLLSAALFLLSSSVTGQKDDTLTELAKGKDVVEAVLRKISKSEIFPEDNSFLMRVAYVDTRFGNDDDTFRNNYHGGIWEVDEWIFNRTTNASIPKVADLHTQIQAKFNVNWTTVTWPNLKIPLHSGLAAAIYFAGVVAVPIPQTIALQAAHWKRFYRAEEDIAKFVRDSEELRNQTRCRGKMDLCIVLDSSGSIGRSNYQKAKDFTAEVIESFTLDFTRIGMLVYSSRVEDTFELGTNLTIPQMATRARNAIYLNSGTRTDFGISRAVEMFKNVPENEGVPKVMMVLTDGNSDGGSNLTGAVGSIRANNIKSLSVGIGGGINRNELLLIALNDNQSVFQLADFTSLQDFLFQLTSVTCDVPQKPEINGTYEDSLEQNEKRTYEIELPSIGITINLKVTAGKTNGYWSLSEEKPSSAIHDGTLEESTYIAYPSPSRRRRRSADGRQGEGSGVTLYLAIEGVEDMNTYSISTQEGDHSSGATTIGLTSALILFITTIHYFNIL